MCQLNVNLLQINLFGISVGGWGSECNESRRRVGWGGGGGGLGARLGNIRNNLVDHFMSGEQLSVYSPSPPVINSMHLCPTTGLVTQGQVWLLLSPPQQEALGPSTRSRLGRWRESGVLALGFCGFLGELLGP